MDYFKWRKILTILMIISICFTLFGKISKVFAAVEGEATPLVIYGKEFNLYYKYIDEYYDKYLLAAVQEYSGSESNPYGYNRLYLYASNNDMTYYTTTRTYEGGTFVEVTTLNPTNNGSISYFVGDNTNRYNERFTFDTTVTHFNNAEFIYNASTGFHNIGDYAFQWNNQTTTPQFESGDYNNNYYKDTFVILDANFDVKDKNNNIVFYSNNRRPPELATPLEDLQNLTFDGLSINSWGYSDINFYLLIYDMTLINNDYDYVLSPAREILINKNSSYYQQSLTSDPDSNCIYFVPISDIGLQFQTGGIYKIQFGLKRYYNERWRRTRRGRTDEAEPRRTLHRRNLLTLKTITLMLIVPVLVLEEDFLLVPIILFLLVRRMLGNFLKM